MISKNPATLLGDMPVAMPKAMPLFLDTRSTRKVAALGLGTTSQDRDLSKLQSSLDSVKSDLRRLEGKVDNVKYQVVDEMESNYIFFL